MSSDRKNLFCWIARTAREKSKLLLISVLVLAGVSILLASRLSFQSDVANLLPSSAPRTQAFISFLKEFGATDSLYIILERKSGKEIDPYFPFAEVLAEKLLETGEIAEIQGRIDPAVWEKIGPALIAKALLYLTEEDLAKLEARFSEEGILEQVRELKVRLQSPLGSFSSSWIVQDPLDLWSIFKKHLPHGSILEDRDSRGIFISPDRTMLLMIARAQGFAADVDYGQRLIRKVREAERFAQEVWAKKGEIISGADLSDLTIGLAGGYLNALEDRRLIRRELIVNFSISLIAVLAIFYFSFRQWTAILFALVPLMMSPLLTLGLFSPFLGRLSESTGAFSAILIGLSIDFIILFYSRFLEERSAGMEFSRALEKSLSQTGPGIVTGAVTTAAVYYILLVSAFRGIQELGFLTGTGILLSLLCALFLFPALLALGRGGKKEAGSMAEVSTFGLEKMGFLALRGPGLVIIISVILSAATLVFALQVKINNDPKRLRPPGHSALFWEGRMQQKMEMGQETLILLKKASSLEQALEFQGSLKEKLGQTLSKEISLSGYETLASLVPPNSQQARNLAWMVRQEKEALDPDRVEKTLKRSMEKEGLRVEPFEPGITMLRKMLTNREMLTVESIQGSPLGPLFERFLRKEGDSFLTAAYIHVLPDFWENEKAQTFFGKLIRETPGILITGSTPVKVELENLMAREAWVILLLSFLAVSALIYLDFRSLRLTFLSLLPVVLASIWTLGIMAIGNMPLHFMNLVVFSMVLGIGVDYGLHVIHRWKESPDAGWKKGLEQVSRGIILAALTTMAGFGSLVLSGYPGLKSMGAVALMGVGFSAVLALTLIPCLLKGKDDLN